MRSELTQRLQDIVGAAYVFTGTDDIAPYLTDWRGNYVGKAAAVVRPSGTEEVAAVVRLCGELQVPIVPQGGNTGMVGGSVPDISGTAIVLSLRRMNQIRAIDVANNAMTVEAGCILQAVQDAAQENNRFFPLSLAAEGSCTIGGNLSTNAGGTAVLRYGNARDLVLGIEAVMPDGRIWNGLKALRKRQYRLRPEAPVDGRGRHAWHHHRRCAEALPGAATHLHRTGGRAKSGRSCFIACHHSGGPGRPADWIRDDVPRLPRSRHQIFSRDG